VLNEAAQKRASVLHSRRPACIAARHVGGMPSAIPSEDRHRACPARNDGDHSHSIASVGGKKLKNKENKSILQPDPDRRSDKKLRF